MAPRLSHGSGRYALERKRELMGRSTSTDGVHDPTKQSSRLTRFVDGPDRSHVTTALRTSFGVYVVDPRKHNRSTIQAEPDSCGFTTPFIRSSDENWRSPEKKKIAIGTSDGEYQCRCPEDENGRNLCIPLWMFDETICRRIRVLEDCTLPWETLSDLRALLASSARTHHRSERKKRRGRSHAGAGVQ